MEKSRKYPGVSLAECLEFITMLDKKFNGIASYSVIADYYGVSRQTFSFKARVSASKQFGLIDADGQKVVLNILGKNYLYPVDIDSKRNIIKTAFMNSSLYAELAEKFNGKALPQLDILSNILMAEYGIIKTSKDIAAKAFMETCEKLGFVVNGIFTMEFSNSVNSVEKLDEDEEHTQEEEKLPNVSNVVNKTIPSLVTPEVLDDSFIEQKYETESKKIAKIIIPRDATIDDLAAIRDLFDIIIKRKFKVTLD